MFFGTCGDAALVQKVITLNKVSEGELYYSCVGYGDALSSCPYDLLLDLALKAQLHGSNFWRQKF